MPFLLSKNSIKALKLSNYTLNFYVHFPGVRGLVLDLLSLFVANLYILLAQATTFHIQPVFVVTACKSCKLHKQVMVKMAVKVLSCYQICQICWMKFIIE